MDERPELSTLLWSPKAARPTTVAVRLSDLVVHRNRALRGARIRLDTMALTRGRDGQPVYQARTERFDSIRGLRARTHALSSVVKCERGIGHRGRCRDGGRYLRRERSPRR